ncbi:MAG: DUF2934 domain-containing protein [Steroidobacter sp.]
MASPRNESTRSRDASAQREARESARAGETSIIAAEREPSPIHRERAIAEIAYLLAEKRGFVAGYELDDWLAAEKEVDRMLSPDRDSSAAESMRE